MIKQIYFLLLALILNPLVAQQLRFKHITNEEGLSTNFVRTITQDELGFMWFGTQDGLNKYDGNQIKVFKNDPTNEYALSCSDVTALSVIKPNLMLVGTREGLNFFDPVTEKFSSLQKVDRRLNSHINSIYKLNENSALVGTEGGLFILNFSDKSIKNPYFKVEEKVNVTCIEKVNDEVYVGTINQGLWKLKKNNTLERVEFISPDYLDVDIKKLESITHIGSYAGKMYIGTNGQGIFKIDRQFEIESKISFSKQNEAANHIKDFVVRDNKIFASTGFGIIVYNLLNERVDFYTKQDAPLSLNSNITNCIFSDNENNFWIGTDQGGINISFFRSQKFPNSTYKYETNFDNIYSFCEDHKGSVLLGGAKTFHELNLETGTIVQHNKTFENYTILCIAKESENIYWLGTSGNGLLRYDKSTKKAKTIVNSDVAKTLLCLMIKGENLYAGSAGDGLFIINLKSLELQQFTEKDGLPGIRINTIFSDSKNNVWLGFTDVGLVKMKGFDQDGKLTILKTYTNKGKLGDITSNMVLGINEDKGGNIWAATSTGLSKLLPNNTFYNFYSKDGLASTYLHSILKDSVNNFWMSSNAGIIRFNPMLPEKEIAFKNYNIKDGLLNTEYNRGAAYVSESGLMYFGGNKGFNVFRPSSIKDNLHVPQAYVIGYKRSGTDVIMDTLITYKKYLNLDWRENYFQFELVAMDYSDPTKNKFRYMLEGYDNDWSAPTNVRYVSYTQLPGGEYTFKLKAANNDGIWNDKAFEIGIKIIPPFWKTKAFYLMILIVSLGLIYFYTQYRTRAMKKENKILENKVAERTKELEEKNRDIMGSIQYAKRIQEAILPSKDNIYKKLKKVFILYQPKDIVSGDFYWFAEENGFKIFAVVDCTGHGVPGAFMSMIGHNLLHQIVLEKGVTDPGAILDHLHKGVQEALRQGHNEVTTNDGMDVSIIAINDIKREIRWAGANRPLVLVNANGELSRFEGNKFPIGGAQYDVDRKFTTHSVNPEKVSMAYMFSDGYADQFGGEKGKKFMVKRFHDLLGNIHLKDAEQQRNELKNNFEQWRLNHEQVDDVLIVGIEI
ncbi:ligand-binding sensor domain-containing protein [Aurantibacillus circumpalustris]|uniref:ligand-binding sensor domain-containing protein n=1 Tax=Aurantibacillus circumpalustris TaxID=3036359 RepID=UPI00295B9046|nr:two-component regulator propeller domain-containing protein [Aurantibacillus circumpalustris]